MMLATLENLYPPAAGAHAVMALEVATMVLEGRDGTWERVELRPASART